MQRTGPIWQPVYIVIVVVSYLVKEKADKTVLQQPHSSAPGRRRPLGTALGQRPLASIKASAKTISPNFCPNTHDFTILPRDPMGPVLVTDVQPIFLLKFVAPRYLFLALSDQILVLYSELLKKLQVQFSHIVLNLISLY